MKVSTLNVTGVLMKRDTWPHLETQTTYRGEGYKGTVPCGDRREGEWAPACQEIRGVAGNC